ncbi:hypothetical protein EDB80DRAFT_805921 [Ilyonectria destructans]|nr:hypothetical protein EDB80DRAFT_805921 [Ilyonectria destructans]
MPTMSFGEGSRYCGTRHQQRIVISLLVTTHNCTPWGLLPWARAAALGSLLAPPVLADSVITAEVVTTTYLDFGACDTKRQPDVFPITLYNPSAEVTAPVKQEWATLELPTCDKVGATSTKSPDCDECHGTVYHYKPTDTPFVTMTTEGSGHYATVSTKLPETDCHMCEGTVWIYEPTGLPYPGYHGDPVTLSIDGSDNDDNGLGDAGSDNNGLGSDGPGKDGDGKGLPLKMPSLNEDKTSKGQDRSTANGVKTGGGGDGNGSGGDNSGIETFSLSSGYGDGDGDENNGNKNGNNSSNINDSNNGGLPGDNDEGCVDPTGNRGLEVAVYYIVPNVFPEPRTSSANHDLRRAYNYRGFLFACGEGIYTIITPGVDSAIFVWVGGSAIDSFDTRNAAISSLDKDDKKKRDSPAAEATFDSTGDDYIPLRIVCYLENGSHCTLKLTNPDGGILFDNTPGDNPFETPSTGDDDTEGTDKDSSGPSDGKNTPTDTSEKGDGSGTDDVSNSDKASDSSSDDNNTSDSSAKGSGSGADDESDTEKGSSGAGTWSDGTKNTDLLDLAEGVGGADNLIALITNPDGDSDGDGTSNIYELSKAAGGAENLLYIVEGLGGDTDGLSQLVDHVGGPQKLLDLFAGLGDEDGAYVHAQLGDEGLGIDIEIPGVGHIGIGPASEGTNLSPLLGGGG